MDPPEQEHPIAYLDQVVAAQKRGEPRGLVSICSSNPYVLKAAMRQAREDRSPLLVESTSNQVNQYGGYSGQTPGQFHQLLLGLAQECGLDPSRLLLGGDHLGPVPWQREPAETAMQKAQQLVYDYVRAGYRKIHLDASMPLGGDSPGGLDIELAAARAARLCQAAERAWQERPDRAAPRYIIGTEVPVPGGEVGALAEVQLTRVEDARRTLETSRQAFLAAGLEQAWQRVVGLVVQPGVDFGSQAVQPYRREQAAGLARFIETVPGLVYEAHSTDYQTPAALRALVQDHFAVLKVGPALTFALREALFGLEMIERELMQGPEERGRSNLQEVVEQEMLRFPDYWQRYYPGAPAGQRLMRRFSLSDRIRYYWPRSGVQAAVERLIANLRERAIPPALLSQYLPQPEGLDARLEVDALVERHIQRVLDGYRAACGWERKDG